MSFIWPMMLVLLLLIPLCVLAYLRLYRRRQRIAERFGNLWLSQRDEGRRLAYRRHVPAALFLIALTLLIFALARPEAVVSLPRIEGTVMLAFDVSGSMAADDLKPTRIEAAKAAAQDFVQRQPLNVRIGVIAFSEGGLAVQAPTNDRDAILASISRLTPQRGTSLGSGILAALDVLTADPNWGTRLYSNLTPQPTLTPTPMPKGTYMSGAIVLLTDGENNMRPDPLAAAQVAADRGVRIYTVGIGSAAGTNLHINGFTVHTQLDEETLQQIAQLTDGVYYNAENEEDLRRIYETLNTQAVIKPEKIEITAIFAGVSILVMLIGAAFSLLWFSRLP
jgi:Ca-activated chloride channel family protein